MALQTRFRETGDVTDFSEPYVEDCLTMELLSFSVVLERNESLYLDVKHLALQRLKRL